MANDTNFLVQLQGIELAPAVRQAIERRLNDVIAQELAANLPERPVQFEALDPARGARIVGPGGHTAGMIITDHPAELKRGYADEELHINLTFQANPNDPKEVKAKLAALINSKEFDGSLLEYGKRSQELRAGAATFRMGGGNCKVSCTADSTGKVSCTVECGISW